MATGLFIVCAIVWGMLAVVLAAGQFWKAWAGMVLGYVFVSIVVLALLLYFVFEKDIDQNAATIGAGAAIAGMAGIGLIGVVTSFLVGIGARMIRGPRNIEGKS